MGIEFDLRQSRYVGSLDQIAPTPETTADLIEASINSELTMPLRMVNTGSLVVSVNSIAVTNPQTSRTRTVQPINTLLPAFTNGTITLPASNGGTVTVTPTIYGPYTLTITSGDYQNIGVALDGAGNLSLAFGSSAATPAAASIPLIPAGMLGIGYIIAHNVGGTIQPLTGSSIVQYEGGGGGSGSIFDDATFAIQNNADPTKQIEFSASAKTTGTITTIAAADGTQTLTLPAGTTTLAGLATAQTFTGFQTDTGGFTSIEYVGTNPQVGGSSPYQLLNTNNRIQVLNPSANITVLLPTTGILAGDIWTIVNISNTNVVSLESSNGSALTVANGINMDAASIINGRVQLVALVNTPTTPANWQVIQVTSEAVLTTANTSFSGDANLWQLTGLTSGYYIRVNRLIYLRGYLQTSTAGAAGNSSKGFWALPSFVPPLTQDSVNAVVVGGPSNGVSFPNYFTAVVEQLGVYKVALLDITATPGNTYNFSFQHTYQAL